MGMGSPHDGSHITNPRVVGVVLKCSVPRELRDCQC